MKAWIASMHLRSTAPGKEEKREETKASVRPAAQASNPRQVDQHERRGREHGVAPRAWRRGRGAEGVEGAAAKARSV